MRKKHPVEVSAVARMANLVTCKSWMTCTDDLIKLIKFRPDKKTEEKRRKPKKIERPEEKQRVNTPIEPLSRPPQFEHKLS